MSELNIPETWANEALENVINGQHGFAFKSKEFNKEGKGIPIVKMGNIVGGSHVDMTKSDFYDVELNDFKEYIVKKNDILMALTDLSSSGDFLGTVAYYNETSPALLNQRLLRIDIPEIDERFTRFIFWYFKSPFYRNYMKKPKAGAIQKNISKTYAFGCDLLLPPMGEQERIVQKIESCFEKIDETEQNLNKVEVLLEKYRESLLAKAFRGELIPQNPDDEPASVLLSKIREEREKAESGKKSKVQAFAPIEDDEKPFEIPESWEWVRLEEILEIQSGGTPKGLPLKSDGDYLDFIKVGDMNNSTDGIYIDNVDIQFSKTTVEKYKIKPLPKGSIIFPKRGGAILTNKKRILKNEASCDTNIMGLLLPDDIQEYFWWWFQSIHLASLHTGSTIPQVNNGDIYPLLFPLPPKAEQSRIVENIKTKLSLLDGVKTQAITYLSSLKESILTKAFEGRLVEQIESEGTGHELLEKILANKSADKVTSEDKKTKKKAVKKVTKKKITNKEV